MSIIRIAATLCALTLAGGASAALLSSPVMPSVFVPEISKAQAKDVILDAARARKWRVVEDKPGVMRLAYPGAGPRAEKHELIVEVKYDGKNYSVGYVKSRGLDEDRTCRQAKKADDPNALCIHRNVPKWMSNLVIDIQRCASK